MTPICDFGENLKSDSKRKQGKIKVLGTDFYWNTIVDKDGVLYRLVFDSFTKRTRWERIREVKQ